MRKVINDFFIQKHLGYTLVIQAQNEDESNKYYDIDFFIKDNKVNYPGFATKEDREYIDYIIKVAGISQIIDYEIDEGNKKIFVEVRS